MKKTYINPNMEIVTLHAMQLLSGSTPEAGFSKSGAGSLGGSDTSREDDFDW